MAVSLQHHCTRLFWHLRNFVVRAKGSHYVYVDGCECSSCELETVRAARDSEGEEE